MIDLHSHILPGFDDGSPDLDTSLEMARVAVAEGITTIAATPHVNLEYAPKAERVESAVGALNLAFREEEIPLRVVAGAEVALISAADMDPDDLRAYCLGEGPYVLVESPYVRSVPFLEQAVFNLQIAGLRPVLAHPERSPLFLAEPERLGALVERGVLGAFNAGSLAARSGSDRRRFTLGAIRRGWVHLLCSDSHDPVKRPPSMRQALVQAEREIPGFGSEHAAWLTEGVPAAIVAGRDIPAASALAEPESARRGLFRRR